MHATRSMYALATILATVLVAALALGGCSSNNNDDENVVTGGVVSGRVIAATEDVGLGGVQVTIGNVAAGTGGQLQFTAVASAMSTTPDGAFSITGIPAGTYNRLRVVPNDSLWPQQDVQVLLSVASGQPQDIGRILIFDDLPPGPSG